MRGHDQKKRLWIFSLTYGVDGGVRWGDVQDPYISRNLNDLTRSELTRLVTYRRVRGA